MNSRGVKRAWQLTSPLCSSSHCCCLCPGLSVVVLQLVCVETVLTDEQKVWENVKDAKLKSPDYKNMTPDEAMEVGWDATLFVCSEYQASSCPRERVRSRGIDWSFWCKFSLPGRVPLGESFGLFRGACVRGFDPSWRSFGSFFASRVVCSSLIKL